MDDDCPACEGTLSGPLAHLACPDCGGVAYHEDCYRKAYRRAAPACFECGGPLAGVALSPGRVAPVLRGAAREGGAAWLLGAAAAVGLAALSPSLLAGLLLWAVARPLHGGGPYVLSDGLVLGLLAVSILRGSAGQTLLYYGLYAAWGAAATLGSAGRRGRLLRGAAAPFLGFDLVLPAGRRGATPSAPGGS